MKTWEEGKKNADETFKKELATKKEKLAAEQALQTRTFIVQKHVLEAVMKKRTEFMKDKAAPPAPGTPEGAASGTAAPPVSITPAPAAPGGKIEAVTPAIEVKLDPKAEPGKAGEAPAVPAPEKKDEPVKKTPKRRNR